MPSTKTDKILPEINKGDHPLLPKALETLPQEDVLPKEQHTINNNSNTDNPSPIDFKEIIAGPRIIANIQNAIEFNFSLRMVQQYFLNTIKRSRTYNFSILRSFFQKLVNFFSNKKENNNPPRNMPSQKFNDEMNISSLGPNLDDTKWQNTRTKVRAPNIFGYRKNTRPQAPKKVDVPDPKKHLNEQFTWLSQENNLALINTPEKYNSYLSSLNLKKESQAELNSFFQQTKNFKNLLNSAQVEEINLKPAEKALRILDWLDTLQIDQKDRSSFIKEIIGDQFQKELLPCLLNDKNLLGKSKTYFKHREDSASFFREFITEEELAEKFFQIWHNAAEWFDTDEEFFKFCIRMYAPLFARMKEENDTTYLFSYFKTLPFGSQSQLLLKIIDSKSEIFKWLEQRKEDWSVPILSLLNIYCNFSEINGFLDNRGISLLFKILEGSSLTLIYNQPKLRDIFVRTNFFSFKHPSQQLKLSLYKNSFKNMKLYDEKSNNKIELLIVLLKLLPSELQPELMEAIITKENQKVFSIHSNPYLREKAKEDVVFLNEILGSSKNFHELYSDNLASDFLNKDELNQTSAIPKTESQSNHEPNLIFQKNELNQNLVSAPAQNKPEKKSTSLLNQRILGFFTKPGSKESSNEEIKETLIKRLQTYIDDLKESAQKPASHIDSLEVAWGPNRLEMYSSIAKSLIEKLQVKEYSFVDVLYEVEDILDSIINHTHYLASSNPADFKEFQELDLIFNDARNVHLTSLQTDNQYRKGFGPKL